MAVLNSSIITGSLTVTGSIIENGNPLVNKYFSPSTTAGTYLATRNANGTITATSASTMLKGTYNSSTGVLTITSI